jgi:divalent metal cation (Fe/Co/Zn/Cd) transporter
MPPYKQLRAFATFVSVILIFSGLYIGYVSALNTITTVYPNPPDPTLYTWWWIEKIPLLTSAFIMGSIDIISVGVLISIFSSTIYYLFVKEQRFWGTIRSIILAIWMWALLKRTGVLVISTILGPFEETQINLLILVAILGIVTMVVTLIVTRILRNIYSSYFKVKKKEDSED